MVESRHKEATVLKLTEDEALALLVMCMLSPVELDSVSEGALAKLSLFCRGGKGDPEHPA